MTLKSASDVKAAPKSATFTIKPLKRGKDGVPEGYMIITANGCDSKYLLLGTSLSADDDYDSVGEDVSVELTKSNKWTWMFKSLESTDSEIDCLNLVDLIPQNYRTSLSPNSGCNGLRYDDESEWKLIPV